MKVSDIKYEDLNNDIIDKILYEGIDDDNKTGDCVLVLGSRLANEYRVPKAVNIYKSKRSSKILMSGGRILETAGGQTTEANMMKHGARKLDVIESDILLEEHSLTTKENIICSLLSLERSFKLSNVKRILLVTTRYHMRRSMLMAKAYMPKWIEIVPCPADDTNTLRHNWYKTERGFNRAKEEAKKVIYYIREGSIEDFEI